MSDQGITILAVDPSRCIAQPKKNSVVKRYAPLAAAGGVTGAVWSAIECRNILKTKEAWKYIGKQSAIWAGMVMLLNGLFDFFGKMANKN